MSDADALELDNGIGTQSAQGTVQFPLSKTTTFHLTAKNAHGSQTWMTTATVAPPITVQGRILDSTGNAVSAAKVLIAGHAPVQTGADGSFEVAAVGIPYALMVSDATGVTCSLYQGLTSSSPTGILEVDAPHRATTGVNLTVTGLSFPVASGTTRTNLERLILSAPEFGSASFDLDPATGTVGGASVAWDGAASISAGARVEVWSYVNAREPVGYYSKNAVTLTDGQPLTLNANVAQVGAGASFFDFYFNASSPKGYAASVLEAREYFGAPGIFGPIPGDVFPDGYLGRVWAVPGASGGGVASAASGTGAMTWSETLRFTAGELDKSLPPTQLILSPAVSLELPVEASTPTLPVTFRWTDASPKPSSYRLQVRSGGKTLDVISAAAEVAIPDLSAVGFSFNSGLSSTWRVWRYGGGLGSPDALAVPEAARLDVWSNGTAHSHSLQRGFTMP